MRRLKGLLIFVLALQLVMQLVWPPLTVRADEPEKNQTEANPVPDFYSSESGDQVIQVNGKPVTVSSSMTAYVPPSADEVAPLAEEVANQVTAAEATSSQINFYETGSNGIHIISKERFLEIGNTITGAVVKEFKADPLLPLWVIGRFKLQARFVTAVLVATGIPHNIALPWGGAVMGGMSATLMLFAGLYTRWLDPNNLTRTYEKGLAIQLIFGGVLQAMMAAHGYPLQHGLLNNIISDISQAVVGNATQLATTMTLSIKANELTQSVIAEHPEVLNAEGEVVKPTLLMRAITSGRNLGLLGMSGYIAYVSSLQMAGGAHSALLSPKVLYSAVAIPSWLYVAYKKDWWGALKSGWKNRQSASVGDFINAFATLQMTVAVVKRLIRGPEINGLPLGLARDIDKGADQIDRGLKGAECRGIVGAL